MQGRLRSSYLLMGQQNAAPVSPVGAVWRDFRANNPNVNLYTGDESHPNINGSYLAACTFYASIYHSSPIGAWKPTTMDSTLALAIQTQVNTTVFDSLNVWGIDTTLPPNNTIWTADSITNSNCTVTFVATDSLNLDSVTWDFGAGQTGVGFKVSHTYFNSGVFPVTSKHYKNCLFSTNNFYHSACNTFSVAENAATKFKIYPNPSSVKIAIETELNGTVNYSIQASTGQNVKSGALKNKEINLSDLSEGLYILILEVNGKRYRQKLIKTN